MQKNLFYSDKLDYIHLKFGEARKLYNFTDDFEKKYPVFCAEYKKYYIASNEYTRFRNAYVLINYIEDYDIPVRLYLNFSDEEVTTKEALNWWFQNNTVNEKLDN